MTDFEKLEARIAVCEDALIRGTQQFEIIILQLGEVKTHLARQDETMVDTKASMSGIVDMWESGIRGVKFACRCVKAWDWMIAQTLSKRGLTLLAIGLLVYRVLFNSFPDWIGYVVAVIKFIEGAAL